MYDSETQVLPTPRASESSAASVQMRKDKRASKREACTHLTCPSPLVLTWIDLAAVHSAKCSPKWNLNKVWIWGVGAGILLTVIMCALSKWQSIPQHQPGPAIQFNSDTNYSELAQTSQVKDSVLQDRPHFRCQLQMRCPAHLHFYWLATNLWYPQPPPRVWKFTRMTHRT